MKTTRQKRTPQCESWGSAKIHRDKVAKKQERIDGLKDLLDTYEKDPDSDHAYVLHLRAQLRCAINQKLAMKPVFDA